MDQKRIEELKARIERFPGNVLDRFVLCKLYHDAGAWNETVSECRGTLSLQPDYLIVHIFLGRALAELGRKEEAREVLEKGKALAVAQKHQGPQEEIEELLSSLN